MYVCICMCVYVGVYVCMCVCTCAYVSTCVYMCVCMSVCVYVRVYSHSSTHRCARVCACVLVCVCLSVHVYTCMRGCVRVCVYIPARSDSGIVLQCVAVCCRVLQCGAVGVRRGGLYRGENKEHKYKRVEGGGALKDFDTLPYLYICMYAHTYACVGFAYFFEKMCVCVRVCSLKDFEQRNGMYAHVRVRGGGYIFPK